MTATAEAPRLHITALVAFGLMLFILGCSVGALIPAFPDLLRLFHVSFRQITLFTALLGYASILFAYPAAWLTARLGAGFTVRLAATVLAVGLVIRAVSHQYTPFLLGQMLVVLPMPLCYGPVGAILRACGATRLHGVTSVIIGAMPLGLGLFAIAGHRLAAALGLFPSFGVLAAAAVVVGALVWYASIPLQREARPDPHPQLRLRYSPRWVVAFCVFGIPNTVNIVAAPAMLHLHIPDAPALGGLLGGLVGFGGSLVTMLLGTLGDWVRNPRRYIQILAVINIAIVGVTAGVWSGRLPFSYTLAEVMAVLCGGFGFAIFSLLNAEGAIDARRLGQAGVNTSTVSMGGNIGGALLQSFIAPFVVTNPTVWVVILTALSAAGAAFAFATGQRAAAEVADAAQEA